MAFIASAASSGTETMVAGEGGISAKDSMNEWPARSLHLSLGRPRLKGKVIYDHKHSNLKERGPQEQESQA